MFRLGCLLTLLGALIGCSASPAPGTAVTGSPSLEQKSDEPRILDGHTKNIERLVFSPDGRTLASTAFDDTKVKLWDVASGQLLHSLPTPPWSVAFTANSKTLLMAAGKEIRVWEVATGKEQRPIERAALCLAISKDGSRLASAAIVGKANERKDRWEMTISDWPSLIEMKRFGDEGSIEDVAFSPNGRSVFVQIQGSYFDKRDVGSYGVVSGKRIKGIGYDAWCVALSPDGNEAALGRDKGQINIYDAHSGWQRLKIKAAELPVKEEPGELDPLRFYGLAYSPDGKFVAAAIRDSVKVFEAETGKLLVELKSEAYTTGPVAFSPDGKILASGRREILFWDMTGYAKQVNGQTQ